MPIYECDPWRLQYFTGTACPPDVHIPTDDMDGYRFNPRHRWIYNKLLIAKSQGLDCGLSDEVPTHYPTFSKPVVNLKGMGVGTHVLNRPEDLPRGCPAGNFWMTLLTGEHVSTDFAIVNGRTVWCRHTLGIPAIAGTFDYWIVQARARPTLENTCRRWISTFLSDYTGMLNLETIGGYIIEAHLRFADQWPDLYGRNWLDSVVRLYQFGTWDFNESRRSDGYSIVLFGPHDRSYVYPSIKRQTEYRATPGIDSVQITFFADQAAHLHAMPPGGFRLAIINTKNMATGILLRESIARDFGVRQGSDVRPSRRSQEVSYG